MDLATIKRQCAATAARPLWRLPGAWFEPGCAERMADWINRYVPASERLGFSYGQRG